MGLTGCVARVARVVAIAVVLTAGLLAQPTTTTVIGPLYAIDGTPAEGTLFIRISQACVADDGSLISALTANPVQVTTGQFSIPLVPNDAGGGGCNGTFYRVQFQLTTASGTASPRADATMSVTTSASPLNIATLITIAPGGTISTVPPSGITGGLVKGDLLVFNGTVFDRFAAGANGRLLAANSATASGLEWIVASGTGTVTNADPLTLDFPVFGAGSNAIKVGTKTGTGTEAVMSQEPTVAGPVLGNLAEGSCSVSLRGKLTFVQGGAGVPDTARICAKNDLDVYEWRPIL